MNCGPGSVAQLKLGSGEVEERKSSRTVLSQEPEDSCVVFLMVEELTGSVLSPPN